MWIRSAFWIGRPRAGAEAGFADLMCARVIPAMRRFPGVDGVRLLWPRRREDGPPDLYCQVLVEFADAAALERMMASAERLALRPQVRELAALFDGSVSHIDYEVDASHASEMGGAR